MQLSPELNILLQVAVEHGYTLRAYHVRGADPAVIAARHYRGGVSDVFVVRPNGRAWAYRAPARNLNQVIDPWNVVWCTEGRAGWVLNPLLRLAAPTHPDAPRTLVRPPGGLGIRPHLCTPIVRNSGGTRTPPRRIPFTTVLRAGVATLLRRLTGRREVTHAAG